MEAAGGQERSAETGEWDNGLPASTGNGHAHLLEEAGQKGVGETGRRENAAVRAGLARGEEEPIPRPGWRCVLIVRSRLSD